MIPETRPVVTLPVVALQAHSHFPELQIQIPVSSPAILNRAARVLRVFLRLSALRWICAFNMKRPSTPKPLSNIASRGSRAAEGAGCAEGEERVQPRIMYGADNKDFVHTQKTLGRRPVRT